MFKPYKYTKELPSQESQEEEVDTWELRIHIEPLGIEFKKLLSAVLVVSGLFLVTSQILLPWATTPSAEKPLLKPTAPTVAGASSKIEVGFEFTELAQQPEPKAIERSKNVPRTFYLTVPKLGIEKAEVETNSRNLSPDERLGHYVGSALPGAVGNTFIYGHSALPIFFSPKDYRTIFSTLDKLEEGDEVTVEFGKEYFKYVVEKVVVLNPEDVKPLEPIAPAFLRQSYLTLMTCVPPGIRTKRLLVQARLQY